MATETHIQDLVKKRALPKMIDLTPVIEEGMAANHVFHPRGPFYLPNQRYEMGKIFYDWTWSRKSPLSRAGAPPLYDGMPAEWAEGSTGRGWANEEVILHGHLGAHIDAATHFNPESPQDAANIPLESCIGSAVLLDFRHLGEEPFEITVADLEAAENRAGERIEEGDIVLLHTGWLARWAVGPTADRARYSNIPNPGLHRETPIWFIERGVKVVGGDMPNLDFDMTSSCHINFLCREAAGKQPIQIIENLANLDQVPVSRFLFIGFPLPLRQGTGSPIRAVALIEEG